MAARPPVHGVDVDAQTRCRHYHSERDIVAIRMYCCGEYYSCRACHDELALHPAQVWPQDVWDGNAILCGSCGLEFSICSYLACLDQCPSCNAAFNPGCAAHHHLYFETAPAAAADPAEASLRPPENHPRRVERIMDEHLTGA